jgi:tetratricopeptide (TPR) repeat protein
MAEITEDKLPPKVRDLFNKGFTCFERGNTDYAIDILISVVAMVPEFHKARKFIRAAEIRKLKQNKVSSMTHSISSLTGLPAYLKTMAYLKGKKMKEAMEAAEQMLKVDALNIKYIKTYAEVAVAADMPEAAIITLEAAREFYPRDVMVLNYLGALYQKVGRMSSARECFERLCEISPGDPDALKMLKDAMALDSMSAGGWKETAEKGGSFRQMVKDSDKAKLLEQQEKAVKTDADTESLIEDTLKKIEAEPKNINYYRSLSRLYSQVNRFDDAIATLGKAREISPGDPELDNAASKAQAAKFEFEVRKLREAGEAEAADAREFEMRQYLFTDLQERVERYPNDTGLRYEWGAMLLENDYVDEAIQQFQRSQRSPKHRIRSFYNLALCFKRKNQFDMAREQLETAASEQVTMDEMKKNILYELGVISETMGDIDKATAYFKQIYQVDIGYRDIAQKIDLLYQQKQATGRV